MTARQCLKFGPQFGEALQVLFLNLAPDRLRDLVKVTGSVLNNTFIYKIQVPLGVCFDTVVLTHEIEKMLPKMRVTSAIVCFSSSTIIMTVKELGKRGTYVFNFVLVRA